MDLKWNTYSKIGETSGFGEVYEARKIVNGIEQPGNFALKKLTKTDEDSIERFKREVRYLDKLDHPRIVKCEGYGLQAEPYFYTMARYKTSLSSIQNSLANDLFRLKTIYNNILEGIEYLHIEGYYHRDLKPGNVLLNSDNDLVLCDLGLCVNPLIERGVRITRTYMAGGSEYYSSPEQDDSLKRVDHRTDIYSFGKMLYEAFTGTRPRVLDMNQLPPAIQFVIRKCTKESPSERFDSISLVKQHFNNAMDILIAGDQVNDLLQIIDELNKFDVFDFIANESVLIDKLADSLSRVDDDQYLHENIMKINSEVYYNLYDKYPDLTKRITHIFIEDINNQNWPFSYTDTLAIKYREIFKNIDDIDIKEKLLLSILNLGANHNRWYVMGVFIELLYTIVDEGDAHSIYHTLSSESYALDRVLSNINIDFDKLHSVLKKLF